MITWLSRHLQTLLGSLGRLSQHPFSNLLTALVIGIALALPACLHMLVHNVQIVGAGWNRTLNVTLYLKESITARDAQLLQKKLQQRHSVADTQLITADAGLQTFRAQSGFGAALDSLTENPLPHVIVITPDKTLATSPAELSQFATALQQLPEVAFAQFDTAWVERLLTILNALQRTLNIVTLLLSLGVVIIISNTIRLDIQNQRDEIEVAKFIGASDAFVRRPFLYNGFWYGLTGGLLAWTLVSITVWLLKDPILHIFQLYGSTFQLVGLNFRQGSNLLITGIVVGWLGAFLAANRHIRAIEPH